MDSLLCAVGILLFGVLTFLDKNLLYCIIIAHFSIVLVVAVRLVVNFRTIWSGDNQFSLLVYFILTTYHGFT